MPTMLPFVVARGPKSTALPATLISMSRPAKRITWKAPISSAFRRLFSGLSGGVRSALLTCKVKTIHLLGTGAEIAVAAETPPPAWVERYGQPPNIYSREINYWLWEVAVDILKHRHDIGLLYVHT